MSTKWFKYITRGRFTGDTVTGIKAIDGSTITFYGSNRGTYAALANAILATLGGAALGTSLPTVGACRVSFGSGTTPPTEEDYTLENFLTDVTYTAGTRAYDLGDEQDTVSNTFMITNNGSEAITVSEVGAFCPVPTGGSTSSAFSMVMVDRKTFAPITIPPGESGTVKYEITTKCV